MRRRRKKPTPIRTTILWSISLALVGWGLWQANQLRLSVVTPPPLAIAATSQPDAVIAMGDTPETSSAPIVNINTTLRDPPETLLESRRLNLENFQATPAFDPALTPNELIAKGNAALNAAQTVAARFAFNEALARTADDAQSAQLRQALSTLNTPIFLGSQILPADPAARIVLIQPGDNFYTIARAWGINAAFLQILNPALNPNNLKPDTGIKIVQGPFHARIVKHAQRLDLYARDIYVTSFPIDFPEGNLLPRGDYLVSPGTKLQLANASRAAPLKTWIGFQGIESATDSVTSGWIFASAGPRGTDTKNRSTGVHLSDADLQQLYNTLTEGRSEIHVEP
jgi:hypothetical protein